MQSETLKRYYTPQFSPLASISIRRFSWAMNVSMPEAINIMVRLLPSIVSASKVCNLCKDKTKCQSCAFSSQSAQQEQDTLSQLTEKEQNAIQAVF